MRTGQNACKRPRIGAAKVGTAPSVPRPRLIGGLARALSFSVSVRRWRADQPSPMPIIPVLPTIIRSRHRLAPLQIVRQRLTTRIAQATQPRRVVREHMQRQVHRAPRPVLKRPRVTRRRARCPLADATCQPRLAQDLPGQRQKGHRRRNRTRRIGSAPTYRSPPRPTHCRSPGRRGNSQPRPRCHRLAAASKPKRPFRRPTSLQQNPAMWAWLKPFRSPS